MAALKISVVVPVFNPGDYIDPLLDSLKRQSLPAEDFEAIFVDDGSTDGTPERLEALAAEVPGFRVMRIPASGGPGKPRNLGVDAARGKYVQFVDNDDHLGDEALERLWAYAEANGSDVVVGKEVRPRNPKPMGSLFRRNRPRATLAKDPLLHLLTPHKLFRRQFLIDNDIRFAHGPKRLIDHAYVVEAYFRAGVISVLSDYACYYWLAPRPDRSNASLRPHVWKDWYGDMRAVLDVVVEHTEPGAFRDRLLSHWYSSKGLNRIGGKLQRRSEGRPRELLEALRELALERFPPSVDQHLNGINRGRSQLLRAGDFDTIEALAEAERGIGLHYALGAARGLEFDVTATLTYRDGTPVRVERRGDRWYWRLPAEVGGVPADDAWDLTEDLARTKIDVILRHEDTGERVGLPGETRRPPLEGRTAAELSASRTVRIDPEAGAGLRAGVWTPRVQLKASDWGAARDLIGVPGARARLGNRPAPAAGDRQMAVLVEETGEVTLGTRVTGGGRRGRGVAPHALARLRSLARRLPTFGGSGL